MTLILKLNLRKNRIFHLSDNKPKTMNFPFNCEKLLGSDTEGFCMIDGRKGMN